MIFESAHARVKKRNRQKTKRAADSAQGNDILLKNLYVDNFSHV